MRKIGIFCLALLLLFFSIEKAAAVSEAAVLFLLISPSPSANGMGQTSIALPDNEPMAMIYNPAHLGIFALNQRIAVGFYPTKTSWLPQFSDDLKYDCKSLNFAFGLNRHVFLGIGYYRIFFDLGEQIITGEESPIPICVFNSWEKAHGLNFGIGFDKAIKFSLGMGVKFITSQLAPFGTGVEYDDDSGRTEVTAYDFGGLVQVPLFDLIFKDVTMNLGNGGKIKPFFDSRIGYVTTNIGEEIQYIDALQKDPLPRLARLGMSINFGLMIENDTFNLKAISITRANEGTDLLVRRKNMLIEYRSFPGDLDFIQNIVLGKGNRKSILTTGTDISLLEAVYFRNGKYDDYEGKVRLRTSGRGISISGILKLISLLSINDKSINSFCNHCDIQIHWSEYRAKDDNPLHKTTFKGINLLIR